ncbi:insulinase family protein [Idiomarina seosinensis]|uniref:Protease 3 n=1 Tax=Idiomarina seosinensis TaxID=281739 RepID=A0A432ZGP7_9GAMM|nr:insulinase family protein [Idiomarina seosinensis]RUO77185.1 peptidase M16 [Idiomarina seosinensis]
MTSSSTVDEVVHIVRSPRDKRDYRSVTLDNGLQVLLAHCPDSHKSAAALAVNAGHFNDPTHTQGLAHFLEHMLFLGNHEFPSPTAFSDFLNAYGGQQNAWTGTEFSNFYFDCQANALPQALNYFAAMFEQPLFAQEWIEKERQSIESEFRLKQQDELRRLYQVHKSTANPKHPFSQFSVGNLDTLNDDKNGSLQEKLLQFFKQHYVTQKLRLVIAGPQSLQELEALAKENFLKLPQAHNYAPTAISEPLYQTDQLGVLLQVKPVKPARRLIITLPLPSIDSDYAHKTTSFIAHILGYEGPDSLFSCLRERGWINSLSAGGGISGSNFKDFNINIQLTENGEQNVYRVAQLVFNYLRLIADQGIESWRYNERRITAELSFKYQEPAPVGELVSQLSINAHHYPVHDVIYGDFRMDSLNTQRCRQLLSLMVPEKARLTLISSNAATDAITPIYDTPYSMRRLVPEEIEELGQGDEQFAAKLPGQNRFVTEHFEPYALEQHNTNPQRIIDTPEQQLWHLQDPDFRVPKGHIYLNLQAPAVNQSAVNFCCSRVWSELMIDALNEDLYDAEVAGLHFNIYPTQSGITIHTTGLSAGQLPLLQYLMRRATDVRFNRDRWKSVSQQLITNWRSAHQSQPLNLLFSELNLLLQKGLFRLTDMADSLNDIGYQHFNRIIADLFEPLSICTFMHGDWQQQHARELGDLVAANVRGRSHSTPQGSRINLLSTNSEQQFSITHAHPDTAVLHYFQGPTDSPSDQIAIMLLQQLVNQLIFDELRTRQQLGYMVGSQYFSLQRQPGILFFVQSPSATQEQLHQQLQQALVLCFEQLEQITLKSWAHSKSVMRNQLTVTDRSLRVRSQRLWGAIQLGDIEFNRAQKLTEALDQWQLADWLATIHRILFEQPASIRLQSTTVKG